MSDSFYNAFNQINNTLNEEHGLNFCGISFSLSARNYLAMVFIIVFFSIFFVGLRNANIKLCITSFLIINS